MPTHYNFLVEVKQLSNEAGVDEISCQISRTMQILQSSYTKAINKKYDRHGALFQSHFKSKHIEDKNYFISLITYIHQNPIRSKLVEKAEEWEFSSFQDYVDLRNGTLPNKKLLLSRYSLKEINNLTNK